MDPGRLFLLELRIEALITCVGSFSRVGVYKPAHQFLRLLGLMAATLQSEYDNHHMHPIQWYLKQRLTPATHRLCHHIFINRDLVHTFSWGLDRQHLSLGILFTSPSTIITITMDASMEGWGSHYIVPGSDTALYSGLWTREERQLHISVLELRAVHLALLQLEQEVLDQMILIESDNMAIVINQSQGYTPTRGQQRVGRLPVVQ